MKTAFERRIDELCEESDLSPTALSVKAGLSKDTINKWVRNAQLGKLKPQAESLKKLAEFVGRSTDWLLSGDNATSAATDDTRIDTKGMSEEAASMLVQLDGLSEEEAWLLMRNTRLHKPSVAGYYEAARRKLVSERGKGVGERVLTEAATRKR